MSWSEDQTLRDVLTFLSISEDVPFDSVKSAPGTESLSYFHKTPELVEGVIYI